MVMVKLLKLIAIVSCWQVVYKDFEMIKMRKLMLNFFSKAGFSSAFHHIVFNN